MRRPFGRSIICWRRRVLNLCLWWKPFLEEFYFIFDASHLCRSLMLGDTHFWCGFSLFSTLFTISLQHLPILSVWDPQIHANDTGEVTLFTGSHGAPCLAKKCYFWKPRHFEASGGGILLIPVVGSIYSWMVLPRWRRFEDFGRRAAFSAPIYFSRDLWRFRGCSLFTHFDLMTLKGFF